MGTLYKDVDIIERTTLTPEGRVVKTYRIMATSKLGIRFAIDVLEAEFTKEKVSELLTQRAKFIDEIKAL